MSVDVEDYFHVSVFDGIVPRCAVGAHGEPRRAPTPNGCWTSSTSQRCAARSSCLAGSPSAIPTSCATIARRGHEIASHGYAHRLIYDQTPAAFREDVRRAKRSVRGRQWAAVSGYRAPSYSITPRSLWALDILIEEGYGYDSSIFPIRHDRYGIPVSPRQPYSIRRATGRLVEVPGSTARLGPLNLPVAGGGYFRILPYPGRAGASPGSTPRGPTGGVLSSSVGNRSRPASAAGGAARSVPSLPKPGPD